MHSKRFDPPASKSFSKGHRVSKSGASFSKSNGITKSRHDSRHDSRRRLTASMSQHMDVTMSPDSNLTPSIVTLVIGRDQRIFAAHEDVLSASPWFQQALSDQYTDSQTAKRVHLPDDEPEIFSSVLEYLYKGDYYPRLIHNKRRNSWEIEQLDEERGSSESTVYHHGVDGDILKDTIIYCTADRYGLEELKRVALRKQGLPRYAYANTPDTDSKLRAHYLALIIRSRGTFKRSGTMQLEMYNGGTQLFFDLFVALCNHVDDVSSSASNTPRSNRHFF
ncbi:hypothetical protein GQX73_g7529 [Xylaria multiplex]|uniref:BTB domain-containing protein n=1 Tax=Xylaria multiplex TaxID=323545 RepID=A0A7C8MQ75_9PEZI|nr:hypothetical protein GQX73_g7529 [Xylaria multiplex]